MQCVAVNSTLESAGALPQPHQAITARFHTTTAHGSQLLGTYSFPGNVRELEALIFDAVTVHQGAMLSLQTFRDAISGKPELAAIEETIASSSLAALYPDRLPTLKEAEQVLIADALRRADGNQGVAAGLLGISRQALNKRLARQRHPSRDSE